jgi:predicted PurR-regulated permease PerM
MLGQQAWGAYKFVDENIQTGGFFADLLKWEEGSVLFDSFVWVQDQVGQYVNLAEFDIWANIKEAGQSIADWLTKQVGNLASGLLFFGINLFIFVFALYYFFKDSSLIVDKIMSISPLPKKHEYALLAKFKDISYGTLYGIFLASVIQGILGGIGFTIVGIPNAVFWGAAIAIFSLVPVFGTGVIWVPAGIILLVQGNYVGGIFLLAWGVLLISTVDNFLRAYFIGERTNMNQLLTFLAVIGGLWYFGLAGVIFGPLILNIFLTLLSIYESEYDNVLHPHDE